MIVFSTPGGSVQVSGQERRYAGGLCARLFWAVLDVDRHDVDRGAGRYDRLLSLLRIREGSRPPLTGDYLRERHAAGVGAAQLVEILREFVCGAHDALAWRGRSIDGLSLHANTAIVAGSDPVRLLARVHASCEVHGFVRGEHRAWLADLVDRGLASGVLHRGAGWDRLSDLLRSSDADPVVMSDTSGEVFPSADLALADERPPGASRDWTEEQWEAWTDRCDAAYEWPRDRLWRRALAGLVARSAAEGDRELQPATWADFRFTHCLSALDLLAEDYAERLDRALRDGGDDGDE